MTGIEFDTRELEERMDVLGNKVFPRAAADALTSVGFEAQKALKSSVGRFFDKPTPFTERGFRVEKASFKRDPVQAEVFVLKQQARYLKFQVFGGTRKQGDIGATGKSIMLPTDKVKLNKFGSFVGGPVRWLGKAGTTRRPGKELVGEFGKKKTFGVWLRSGGKRNPKLSLIAAFRKSVTYEPNRFPFFDIVEKQFDRDFDKIFNKKFEEEISRASGWKK